MSKYPLDQEALVEEYGDLLIKIALKAYMKEQAQLLEQEEAEAAPVPAPKGNVQRHSGRSTWRTPRRRSYPG